VRIDQHHTLTNALKVLDLIVMAACFAFAAILTAPDLNTATLREFAALRISIGNFAVFGLIITLWHLLFSVFGLYGDPLRWQVHRKAIEILKATSVGTCVIVLLAFLAKISFVDLRFVVIFWGGTSSLSVLVRLIIRELVLQHNSIQSRDRKILIVGVNNRSLTLARHIEADKLMGCRIVGFVDDTTEHADDFGSTGYQVVAGYDELSEYLAGMAIDEVLVCMPIKSRASDMTEVVSICEEQGIAVGILRDLFRWNLSRSQIRKIGDQVIFTVQPHSINRANAATKRSLDVVLSLLLIFAFLPVFLVAAVAVRLTSPGPVLFSQERVGLNKTLFRMLKFRSMVAEAESQQAALESFNEAAGPAFKIRSDPRVTPVGRLLRKYSVDELPQLINVLIGDMSLVGPRPLPLRDYARFSEDWHRRRVSVRPGLTGLWQVESRDHSSFDEWIKLDLRYIDDWSLSLDFQIMLKTVVVVLRGSGT
jgi:exopolysaccharide biosynthesis polyprenyl glycosylphosphotransferase